MPLIDSAPVSPLENLFNVPEAASAAQFAVRQIKSYKWASQSAQNAQTGMAAGDIGYRTDKKADHQYDGAAWIPTQAVFASAVGSTVTGAIISALGSQTVTITFPSGRFTQIPAVFANTNNSRLNVSWGTVSTTGATIVVGNWSNGAAPAAIPVVWQAIQMFSAATNG